MKCFVFLIMTLRLISCTNLFITENNNTVDSSVIVNQFDSKKHIVHTEDSDKNIVLFDFLDNKIESYNLQTNLTTKISSTPFSNCEIIDIIATNSNYYFIIGNEDCSVYVFDGREITKTYNSIDLFDIKDDILLCSEIEYAHPSAFLYTIDLKTETEVKLNIRGNSGIIISSNNFLICEIIDNNRTVMYKYNSDLKQRKDIFTFNHNLILLGSDADNVYFKTEERGEIMKYNMNTNIIESIYNNSVYSVIITKSGIYATTYDNKLIFIDK